MSQLRARIRREEERKVGNVKRSRGKKPEREDEMDLPKKQEE